jgi:hypothetical protein
MWKAIGVFDAGSVAFVRPSIRCFYRPVPQPTIRICQLLCYRQIDDWKRIKAIGLTQQAVRQRQMLLKLRIRRTNEYGT